MDQFAKRRNGIRKAEQALPPMATIVSHNGSNVGFIYGQMVVKDGGEITAQFPALCDGSLDIQGYLGIGNDRS